jgi:hypothetical protein
MKREMRSKLESFHKNAREEKIAQERQNNLILRMYDDLQAKFNDLFKQNEEKVKQLEVI